MLNDLKECVYNANMELADNKLVILTWGNVSGIDRDNGMVVIKPSGMRYCDLTPDALSVVDLEGNHIEGSMKPSSDLATYLEIYRAWPKIGGIAHTHSPHATMFAQACRPIPCLGTTHADYFYGDIPVTRVQSPKEITTDYERNTGRLIVETYQERKLNPMEASAVLVAKHGPFSWGSTPEKAVESSYVAEMVAQMAIGSFSLNPNIESIPNALLKKHFFRKHGENAYYGQ